MDCDCGKNPFPPFYSIDEFIWSTPFVYGPTLLLIILITFGAPRYYHNINKQSTNLSSWSKFIAFACLIVSITFVFDSIVLITRAITEQYWTSTVLAYYIAVSWLSWSLCIIALVNEAQLNQNHWYWIQYLFWFLAVAMETVVGWYWLMGIMKPLPGNVYIGLRRTEKKRGGGGEGAMIILFCCRRTGQKEKGKKAYCQVFIYKC